jgi:hypothetical protein
VPGGIFDRDMGEDRDLLDKENIKRLLPESDASFIHEYNIIVLQIFSDINHALK